MNTCTCCRRSTSPPSPRRRADQQTPACDLAALTRARLRGAAGVRRARSAAKDGFNWGYDPCHYTVPEGSYATDPDGPGARGEFRQMVAGAQRGRAAGRHGRGLQPHRRPPARTPTSVLDQDRARLLPAAARRRRGRDLHLLRQHRARARDDGQARGRLGRHLGQGVQGRRLPLRPDGPPPEGRTCWRSGPRWTS